MQQMLEGKKTTFSSITFSILEAVFIIKMDQDLLVLFLFQTSKLMKNSYVDLELIIVIF